MERVLIVDSDETTRSMVVVALEGEGYIVSEADSAEEALVLVDRTRPDLLLCDVRLPGMSGFELVHRVRMGSTVPIVMVSSLTDSHDIVAGLEAGADDYVTKPFVVKELTARVRAHLRRVSYLTAGAVPEERSGTLCFDDLEIRLDEAVVLVDGHRIALTKTEFQLLGRLASHAGLVLSREQLLDQVWGFDYFGETRLVDAHIRRLRTKIERDPSRPRHIATVRGLGYRFEP